MGVHRAIRLVGTGQVAGAEQELIDYFTTSKPEMLPEQLYPGLLRQRMMCIQPLPEASIFLLQLHHHPCIVHRCLYFQAVADDTGILQQPRLVFFPVSRYPGNLKAMVGPPEMGFLLQDGGPAETSLVDLQDQPAKQLIIVVDGKSIRFIVVPAMQVLFARRRVRINWQ